MRTAKRRKTIRSLLSSLAIGIGSTHAHAVVTVTPNDGTAVVTPLADGDVDVTITVGSTFTDTTYEIKGDDNDDIRFVTINQGGPSTSVLTLDIFSVPFSEGLHNLCAVYRTSGDGKVKIAGIQIEGYLGQQNPLITYDIKAHDIADIEVGTNSYITMEVLDDGDSIESNSRIFNVDILGGSGLHLINEYGPIEIVKVGSMLQPSDINCLDLIDFTSFGEVANLTIGDTLKPDVNGIDISGELGRIGGAIDVVSIKDVRILDLSGDITIDNALPTSPDGVNTQSLIIEDELLPAGSITLPEDGLTSQIVINEDGGVGAWDGVVDVGGTLLAPGYTNSATSLGGGSVGCVPFELHGADCDPAIGTCVSRTSAPDDTDPIEMRHYGPVMWTGATDPFKIERRAIGSTNPNDWDDQSACFSQDPDGSVDNLVLLTSNVLSGDSTGTLEAGFEYRVTLNQFDNMGVMENILRCDVGDAPFPEVADHVSVYIFSVGELSLGDANNDGTVNNADLTSVDANWLTTDCLAEGDADRDGDVDFADKTAVLSNWLNTYTGCTGPSAQSSIFPGPCDRTMEDAIDAMGFASAAEFSVWFSNLSKKDQKLVMTGIDEWLECLR